MQIRDKIKKTVNFNTVFKISLIHKFKEQKLVKNLFLCVCVCVCVCVCTEVDRVVYFINKKLSFHIICPNERTDVLTVGKEKPNYNLTKL